MQASPMRSAYTASPNFSGTVIILAPKDDPRLTEFNARLDALGPNQVESCTLKTIPSGDILPESNDAPNAVHYQAYFVFNLRSLRIIPEDSALRDKVVEAIADDLNYGKYSYPHSNDEHHFQDWVTAASDINKDPTASGMGHTFDALKENYQSMIHSLQRRQTV